MNSQPLLHRSFSRCRKSSRLPARIETLEDRIAPAIFMVTTTGDSGAGSLRQAIINANAAASSDVIEFDIPGFGPHTINLLTELPAIIHPVQIDGTTEPDYLSSRPAIVLNGSGTSSASGLHVLSTGVTIRALTIHSFDETGIFLDGGGGTTVTGCFIGTDSTGTIDLGNGLSGITIDTPNNVIGGTTAAERNVISGNDLHGIVISGATATGNSIRGNYIGTNLLASLQVPNTGSGVAIVNAANNTVGGSAANQGNVISGNGDDDVFINNSNGNNVSGNIIGLDVTMKLELQSKGSGVFVTGTSANNFVGGTTAASRNVIAGHDEFNGGTGITFNGSGTGNTILNNLIGTNPSGDDELANEYGIFVSAPGTVIGDLAGHGNLVAGNNTYGIYVANAANLQLLGNRVGLYQGVNDLQRGNGSHGVYLDNVDNAIIRGNIVGANAGDGMQIRNSDGPIVQGNFFGTNAAGTLSRPNGLSGLAIFDCSNLTVGGTGAGQANVMSANAIYGLYIASGTPVSVFGNRIGTDITGEVALPNINSGISIAFGAGHVIGGPGAGQGNLISGNGRGIVATVGGSIIQGNIIGLDKDAATKLSNQGGNGGGHGIHITDGSDTIIGGNLPGEGNIISGNSGSAIWIQGSGTGNKVLGNIIGTNAAGASGLGNGANTNTHTILVSASLTTIGGPGVGDRNIIVGASGRAINSTGANTIVQGNYVGLAPNGETAIANFAGVAINGSGSGGAVVANNVISGNTNWGIAMSDNSGHVVVGNRIGTNASGTSVVGNGQQGIIFTRVTSTLIGGDSADSRNLIAGSGVDAILINGGTNVTIQNNWIGLNAAGTAALPNKEGIAVTSSLGNAITNITVEDNVIGGSNGSAINAAGSMTNVIIRDNRIGLQAAATGALPNNRGMAMLNVSGITIEGNEIANSVLEGMNIFGGLSGNLNILSNTIHANGADGIRLADNTTSIRVGDDQNHGNEIYGNGGAGILLFDSRNGVIEGNLITGNTGAGILLTGTSNGNAIGDGTAIGGNGIFGNDGAGIAIAGGSGNRVSYNSIFGNFGLAIDLGNDGATANDVNDADTGPNALQNAPVLTGVAVTPGGSTVVLGNLQSAPNSTYRLEFYGGSNGGAQVFLFTTNVQTDSTGKAVFQVDLGAVANGTTIVATATDTVSGNTSELRSVDAAPVVPTLVIGDATVTETDSGAVNAVFTVTLSATPTLPVTFNFGPQNGTAELLADFEDFTGTYTFAAGTSELTMTITVPVLADEVAEGAEKFFAKLTDAQSVLVLDDTGEGTILDDDSTLTIDAKMKIATWRDIDGDIVTLKSSKAILSEDDFVFVASNGGQQLVALLLSDDGASASKTSLSLTAKRGPLSPLGDGRASLGFLDAAGIDLGAVSISGDLGRIEAGDTDFKVPGVKSLVAGSMGFFGLTTQAPGGNLLSEIKGHIGGVTIKGDFAEARFHATGNAGKVSIAGSLTGGAMDFSGSFRVDGKLASFTLGGSLEAGSGLFTGFVESDLAMGKVRIKGGMTEGARIASGGNLSGVAITGELAGIKGGRRALITAEGRIGSVSVGGSVSFTDILAGYTSSLLPVNPDAAIGAVKVTDNWIASNLIAGIDPGADGLFAIGDDDAPAVAAAPWVDNAKVVSKIASIQIGGYVAGTAANPNDHFGFTAQRIGKLVGLGYVLNGKALDTLPLGQQGDVILKEVG